MKNRDFQSENVLERRQGMKSIAPLLTGNENSVARQMYAYFETKQKGQAADTHTEHSKFQSAFLKMPVYLREWPAQVIWLGQVT